MSSHPLFAFRGASNTWGQADEIAFLEYWLPIHCEKYEMDLLKCYQGYVIAMRQRGKFWDGADPSALLRKAFDLIDNPPLVSLYVDDRRRAEYRDCFIVEYPDREPKIITYK